MASENTSPPSYAEATGQRSSLHEELNFVDFIPRCLEPGNLFTKSVYEPFNTLIDRANEWLQETPSQEAKSCESIEFKNKCAEMNYEKMTYLDYGQYSTFYVRGLRLWIIPRRDSSRPPQQIGYINVVPQVSPPDDSMETLDVVVDRFNKDILKYPIPGKILTVETQEMKMPRSSAFDPDKSSWVERGEFSYQFIFVIRVFYEVSEPANEIIGITNFVPKLLKEATMLSFPVFEPFSNVISSAFQWCSEQTEIRFCNAQSMQIKMKSGKIIDTQQMICIDEHGRRGIYFVRILRLAYTKSFPNSVGCDLSNTPVLNLTCKTFVPVQIVSHTLAIPEFETFNQTKDRIVAWVNATGAKIISAETCAIHFLGSDCANHDSSFTYISGEYDEYWIFVIHLFLDGVYPEPPPELLPPMPVVQNDDNCVFL